MLIFILFHFRVEFSIICVFDRKSMAELNIWKKISCIDHSTINIELLGFWMDDLLSQLTENSSLDFHTAFSRLSFVYHQYKINYTTRKGIAEFRNTLSNVENKDSALDTELIQQYTELLLKFAAEINPDGIPPDYAYLKLITKNYIGAYKSPVFSNIRCTLIEIDQTNNQWILLDETHESQIYVIPIFHEKLTFFKSSLEEASKCLKPPISLMLIDASYEGQMILPRCIIIEPDYLVDVTAVSEATADQHSAPFAHFTKKLLPTKKSKSLLEGQAANLFLDYLIDDPQTTLEVLFPKLFALYPIEFSLLSDDEVQEFALNCRHHFSTLQWMVNYKFPLIGLHRNDIFVEPSYYSPQMGIQGRLDLFAVSADEKSSIVELKSGKPFKENKYGLSSSHYYQTLLYDLLIEASSNGRLTPSCYILYSKLGETGLRYAPPLRSKQYEALNERNHFILRDQAFLNSETFHQTLSMHLDSAPVLNGFVSNDWNRLTQSLVKLDELSYSYYLECIAIIAREQRNAKLGNTIVDQYGQASLWILNDKEKEKNYSLLKNLKIIEADVHQKEPKLKLLRDLEQNTLVNFRVGDIAILYPSTETRHKIGSQLLKCTIISVDHEQIEIRLRSSQLNDQIFMTQQLWNLEPDLLDSSFGSQYKALFDFVEADSEKRSLILGQVQANQSLNFDIDFLPEYLNDVQLRIYKEAICAESYYLLWGPPGTGKTSRMLKALTEYYWRQTDEVILIATFTNRAADEICEAIESIDPMIKESYLRIGSRYGSSPKFHERLMQNAISEITNRKDLLEYLRKKRIIVGTLASLQSKPELWTLLNLKIALVDEASQVLETTMASFLAKMQKTILIGDHNQLPAIITQSKRQTHFKNSKLKELGFQDFTMSLFERLYRKCNSAGWESSIGMLHHQGRMHPAIMKFVNEIFYGNQLECVAQQNAAICLDHNIAILKQWEDNSNRVIFIDSKTQLNEQKEKYNSDEVQMIHKLVMRLANMPNGPTVGIITPFRAQIANIKQSLEKDELLTENIMIDTVERFQGGAKDIIIISMCANHSRTLKGILSINPEGIDRKFNVALTRAKHQVIVLGNQEILQSEPVYKTFIDLYKTDRVIWEL